MQNLAGFGLKPLARDIFGAYAIRPYTGTCIICPVSYFPIGMHPKPARFYIQTFGEVFLGAYAFAPYTGTCKIWRVLGANPCRGAFRGVCNTPRNGYVKNPPCFIFPHTDTPKSRPVLYPNPCRRTFRGVCNTPLHGYVQNLAGFTFPHTI